MLNVSSLLGVNQSGSDALRYGEKRFGEKTPKSSTTRRPVVVWNSTKQCNLACKHCYASAKANPSPDEITTKEAFAFLDDLASYEIPAMLLSGGEPLVRPDVFEILEHGINKGIKITLSTNGTLIDYDLAKRIADVGVTYVGVSIDGTQATHDRVRCEDGAWQKSVYALRNLAKAKAKRGIRFTLTPDSHNDLDAVLQLVVDEGIERFCMYHLAPSGRGKFLYDITPEQRRRALHRVFQFAQESPGVEVLTVDNPSDGVALIHWLEARDATRAQFCREKLAWNKGALGGPGIGLAAVDELGNVHPDQFSRHRTIGNIREKPFSEIWNNTKDDYIVALRSNDWPLNDTCSNCEERDICNGALRSRAELTSGDIWGFDPSCSLITV